MKMRIVAKRAGIGAPKTVQIGFPPKGFISHPLEDKVGSKRSGTDNFGVLKPIAISVKDMVTIAIITAKSLTTLRTCKPIEHFTVIWYCSWLYWENKQ